MTQTLTAEHTVASPELRAHIAQREHSDRYPRGTFLPYIHDAYDTLPARVRALIEQGHPRSAEYWLLSAERGAGVLSADAFSRYVAQLGAFHLQSEYERCTCAAGECRS